MTVFICRKQGCDKEAKPGCGGLCLPHALEEAKQRHAAEPEDKKENEMGKEKEKCDECGTEPAEGERLYRKKCKECRSKGVRPRAPRKPKEGKKPKAPPPPKSAAGGSIVDTLIEKLNGHMTEARKIHGVLTGLKALTDEDFEIPEMGI